MASGPSGYIEMEWLCEDGEVCTTTTKLAYMPHPEGDAFRKIMREATKDMRRKMEEDIMGGVFGQMASVIGGMGNLVGDVRKKAHIYRARKRACPNCLHPLPEWCHTTEIRRVSWRGKVKDEYTAYACPECDHEFKTNKYVWVPWIDTDAIAKDIEELRAHSKRDHVARKVTNERLGNICATLRDIRGLATSAHERITATNARITRLEERIDVGNRVTCDVSDCMVKLSKRVGDETKRVDHITRTNNERMDHLTTYIMELEKQLKPKKKKRSRK